MLQSVIPCYFRELFCHFQKLNLLNFFNVHIESEIRAECHSQSGIGVESVEGQTNTVGLVFHWDLLIIKAYQVMATLSFGAFMLVSLIGQESVTLSWIKYFFPLFNKD